MSSEHLGLEKIAWVGAATGALSAEKDRRWEGAGKGFLYGDIVGGTLGAGAGLGLLGSAGALTGALGGAVLGGYLAGKTARGKEKKAMANAFFDELQMILGEYR